LRPLTAVQFVRLELRAHGDLLELSWNLGDDD